MSKFSIYSKDGSAIRFTGQPKYAGSYLNVGKLEFSEVSSPVPINWEIGDYVDYPRTGLRYRLYSLPYPKKQASPGKYGAAFVYSDVVLCAATKELEIVPYRDLVDSDNGIHFSSRKDFSTYEDVYGIARRIQACMDDLYPDRWKIEVFPFSETDDKEILDKISVAKEFSVDGSCLDALSHIYETWEQIGWIHSHDTSSGKEVITIGRANKRDSSNTSDEYLYGKGKGMKSLKKTSANKEEFCTRLYVYGSERNMLPRYYNGKDIKNAASVDIPNLMLPIGTWGKTGGLPDARKAYLDGDRETVQRYGIIPRTVYFDGNGLEEIFPSIENVTAGDVRAAKAALGETDNIPNRKFYTDEYRLDQIYLSQNPDDDGIYTNPDGTTNKLTETFTVYIPQIGFDMTKQAALTTEGKAVISMKSGMCAGREFIVKSCEYYAFDYAPTVETWKLVLMRTQDDSTGMLYPNNMYRVEQEEKFVILEIAMPELYVGIGSNRLLEKGRKLLADYSRTSPVYEPDMDSIVLSKGGRLLKEGMFLKMHDPDIIDTEDSTDYVLVDSISISETESELPIYKVTLRDSKRAAKSYGALEDMVKDSEKTAWEKIERQRQYTERSFRSILETMSMLQGALDNFTEGITPVTVQTMMMMLGDDSLQFIFTENSSSLVPVPLPVSYDRETKQLTCLPATLVHMTLGIDSIVPKESRKASDYLNWEIPVFGSKVLDDPDIKYYLYAKVDRPDSSGNYNHTGEIVLSEDSMKMESEIGYYNLLIGILNSEYNGTREFVPLYGFTEILPGRITTDLIQSSSGKTYFDLQRGVIGGQIKFESGSAGLENVAEWPDKQKQIDSAQNDAGKALQRAMELQKQVDGVIETFSFAYSPSASNYPANEWDTQEKKEAHVGDVFFNIQPAYNADGTANPDAGKAWRWSQDDTEHTGWHWHPIADSDAVKALQLAQMSVTDTDVLYMQTGSATQAPALPSVGISGSITNLNGWTTEAPEWKEGMYIWQTTYVRKGDGSAAFSDPTCISGRNGKDGSDGTNAQTVAVKSSGWGGNIAGGAGYVKVNGKVVNGYLGRGLNMVTLDRQTLAKVEQTRYDLYTGSPSCEADRTAFVNKVDSLDDSVFVCLAFCDNVTWTQELVDAMKKLGSLGDIKTDGASRTFAFIGYKGLAPGYALQVQGEKQSVPPVEVSAYVADGMFTTSATPVGILRIEEEYYLSTSQTELAGGSWSATRPAWVAGRYYWTRSHVYYTDGTDNAVGEVCVTGNSGTSVLARYSSDKTNWHASFRSGDKWMQTSSDNGTTWSDAIQIVGKDGASYTENLLLKSDVKVDTSSYLMHKYSLGEYRPKLDELVTITIWGELGAGKVSFCALNSSDYISIGNMAKISEGVYSLKGSWKTKTTVPGKPDAESTSLWIYAMPGSVTGVNSRIDRIKLERGHNDSPVWNPAASEMVGLPGADGANGASYTNNLLLNSSFAEGNAYWNFHSGTSVDETRTLDGRASVKLIYSGLGSDNYAGLSQSVISESKGNLELLQLDNAITASLWTYTDSLASFEGRNATLEIDCYKADATRLSIISYNIKPAKENEWQRFVHTRQLPAGTASVKAYIHIQRNGRLWINSPKYETGTNKNPQWSPNPSEMGGQYPVFQWAKGSSPSVAPSDGWQDTPMTANAGEYVWMRSGTVVPPATQPSSWKSATRLTGDRGTDGTSTYLLDLSNEVAGIACDSAGNVTGAYPVSQATVWEGSAKVTSGITYSIASKTGITTASISTAGAVTLSGMTADTASVLVQAKVGNVTLQATMSLYKVRPGAKGDKGDQGPQGLQGAQGVPGPAGSNGKTSYFHIRYSSVPNPASASQMTVTPDTYIGTYVDFTQADSTDPHKYTWARFEGMQGADGAQGIAGRNGEDGKTSYLHIKYSNDGGLSFTPASEGFAEGETPGEWIGQYTDFMKADSTDISKYTWSKFKGDRGDQGAAAVVYSIMPSVNSVTRNPDGTTPVPNVVCTKYKTTGSTPRATTTEHFLYATVYTEAGAGTPVLIAGAGLGAGSVTLKSDTTAIVFELRTASSGSYDVLDRERVPVFVDSAALKEQIDDLAYLKEAFENASDTIVDGGIVMTNLVAVKDSDDAEVEAFLNGSVIGKDAAHGKLLIAGGIPSGTGTLETRARNAKTRIYEDGTIDTTVLNALGGKIGSFTIDHSTGNNPSGKYLKCSDDYGMMMLTSEFITLGAGSKFNKYQKYFEAQTTGLDGEHAVKIDSTRTKADKDKADESNIALRIKSEGATEGSPLGQLLANYAIYCDAGLVAGLRPAVRRVATSTTTLTAYDYMIRITVTCTVTLPAKPQLGQRYEIVNNWGKYLYVDGNGKNIWFAGQSNQTIYRYEANDTLLHILVYDGTEWILTRHDGKW